MDSHLGSGSFWFQKADMSNENFYIEHKFTEKKSFTLSKEVLKILEKQAGSKIPVFVIDFDGDVYCVLKKVDFEGLWEKC